MGEWAKKVRQALKDPQVLAGISAIAAEWMSEHIDGNFGRNKGGGTVEHKPLKTVVGQFWKAGKRRAGATASRVAPYQTKKGTTRYRREYLYTSTSYRAGGQPLRDTGDLYRSVGATARMTGSRLRLTMHGNRYGLYQDRGFTTRGPNYIPLTKKGKRGHGTGQNPIEEGLVRNKDFKMAWKGVTVPARPFILPTRRDMITFGRSIYLGLKAVLKGK